MRISLSIWRKKIVIPAASTVLALWIVFLLYHQGGVRRQYHMTSTQLWQSRVGQQVDSQHLDPGASKQNGGKHAYATFLTYSSTNSSDNQYYLEAVRILTWQLKFEPETKSPANLPVVVLCTDRVPEADQKRLQQWGADIVTVFEPEIVPWQTLNEPRWQDVMTKIRLHDFTDFDRILFIDADTILTRPLDDVFQQPEVEEQITLKAQGHNMPGDEEMPRRFVFAGVHDMNEQHHWPPVSNANGDYWGSDDYLNAGFYVIKPDPAMLTYYRKLISMDGSFPSWMPEQGLFNYAHRQYGSMPWQVLNYTWNVHYPSLEDLEGGAASLHERWWRPVDARLKPYIQNVRDRASEYYGGPV